MSSRNRALAFTGGALSCALLAALVAGGGSRAAGDEFGTMREVVVALVPQGRGTVIGPRELRALEIRRVPDVFAPPDAIADPRAALGERLSAPLLEASYLTASLLTPERPDAAARRSRAPRGTTAVEIAVSAAGVIEDGMASGERVDVVVAAMAGPGLGGSRTYIAARNVPLLGLTRAPDAPGVAPRWTAARAVTRRDALRLIRAESQGYVVRLLAG